MQTEIAIPWIHRHFLNVMKKSDARTRPPLVELRNACVTLGGRPVLRQVSWAVRRGEGWLVTGPNGAGKTTLLRLMAGRLWPDGYSRGETRRFGFSARPTTSPIGLEGRVIWLSPEVHQQFARLDVPQSAGNTILTGFAGTLLLTHRVGAKSRAAARRMAELLGVADLWRRPFAELSQGRQRLVLLARALAPKPKLLVLDEFSDSLDGAARGRAGVAIARRLRAGAAVIVATHRAGDSPPGLEYHLIVNRGKVAIGRRGKAAAFRRRAYARPIGKPPLKLAKARPIIFFKNASVVVGDHQRTRRILHGINWTIRSGEHWAVLGSNGSGKSTLLRAIYGELPVPRGGILERFGRGAEVLPLPKLRRLIGFVSPALQHQYAADASIEEVVASGFRASIGLLGAASRRELTAARAALRTLAMEHLARRRWGAVSFGEARLALLARALAPRPRLLLLDEPCDGLAPAARKRFLLAVDRAARAGTHIIAAAHRTEDLPYCINRRLRLRLGRVA